MLTNTLTGTSCLLLIDDCCVAFDEPGLLERSDPSQACGLGQADAGSKLAVGDAPIELQGPHDGTVVAIKR
jgi:hypothetical protein